MQNGRLQRIFENADGKADVILIVNGGHPDPNFFYISGYTSGLFEDCALFLFPDRRVEVLTTPLEEDAARRRGDYKIHIVTEGLDRGRTTEIRSILRGCRRVGLNYRGLSHHDYMRLETILRTKELVDVSAALGATRMIKDPDELEAISRAALTVSKVMDQLPGIVREGMTERALAAKIDFQMVEEGADSPSFKSIVAFGEDSAIPHHSSGDRRLRGGDNVLVDVGSRCDLYCSDITRTFFLGRAKTSQRDAYATVAEAQAKAVDGMRAGVTGRAVHEIAAGVIARSKFRGRFTHSLGHSIGLEVHDGPGPAPHNSRRLQENMVMTVEPGVYIPGEGGVRIEDDALVTKGSCEVLTKTPRDLIEL